MENTQIKRYIIQLISLRRSSCLSKKEVELSYASDFSSRLKYVLFYKHTCYCRVLLMPLCCFSDRAWKNKLYLKCKKYMYIRRYRGRNLIPVSVHHPQKLFCVNILSYNMKIGGVCSCVAYICSKCILFKNFAAASYF